MSSGGTGAGGKVSVSPHLVMRPLVCWPVDIDLVVPDGGSLSDPKPPHKPHSYGSLSMASSTSRNSSTSQFFICLLPADSEGCKKKLDGRYYPFGTLDEEDVGVLERLERRLGGEEGWKRLGEEGGRCWVADCGVC